MKQVFILSQRDFIKIYLIQSGWRVLCQGTYDLKGTVYSYFIDNTYTKSYIKDNDNIVVHFETENDAWDALIDSYLNAFGEKPPIPVFDRPKDIYDALPWEEPNKNEEFVWVGKGKVIRRFKK